LGDDDVEADKGTADISGELHIGYWVGFLLRDQDTKSQHQCQAVSFADSI
jgi:hypothetical protein